jgi:peptidyl-tRNA hydrolase
LGKFTKEEAPDIDEAIWKAVDAVQDWVRDGSDRVMAKYNG